MILFKKKLILSRLIKDSVVFILTDDSIFPTREALLEQDNYTKKELDDIDMHSRILALSYLYIVVMNYAKDHKFEGRYDELKIGSIFGQSVLDANREVGGQAFENSYVLQNLDKYNVRIVKMRESDPNHDDYFHAFEVFEDMALGKREANKRPVSLITLGKFIRDEVVGKLMSGFIKNHRIYVD